MTPASLPDRQRIALAVEYDGSAFLGWQRLSHGPTVQGALEAALARVANQPIEIQGCGRTDAGVHAINQVVHFDTTADRPLRGWILGCNSLLPSTVAVTWAGVVPGEFHARFWARRRRYRYVILNRAIRPALGAGHLTWERRPLDAERMAHAAQALIGEHDFSAFRAAACQAGHPRRRMHEISVRREGQQVVVEVEANAFLHHMVRNIVGALLPVGRGDREPGWVAELLAGRARIREIVTAPPDGLTFLGPRYPRGYGLPDWLECDDPL